MRKTARKETKVSVRKASSAVAVKKKVGTSKKEGTGLKKQYVKKGSSCKVTFRLPKEAAPQATSVTVVGDFNNWNVRESQMKKLKSGDFTLTMELPCNREYRFRYVIDTEHWENDWFADKYIPNEFGSEDSVVVIEGNGG